MESTAISTDASCSRELSASEAASSETAAKSSIALYQQPTCDLKGMLSIRKIFLEMIQGRSFIANEPALLNILSFSGQEDLENLWNAFTLNKGMEKIVRRLSDPAVALKAISENLKNQLQSNANCFSVLERELLKKMDIELRQEWETLLEYMRSRIPDEDIALQTHFLQCEQEAAALLESIKNDPELLVGNLQFLFISILLKKTWLSLPVPDVEWLLHKTSPYIVTGSLKELLLNCLGNLTDAERLSRGKNSSTFDVRMKTKIYKKLIDSTFLTDTRIHLILRLEPEVMTKDADKISICKRLIARGSDRAIEGVLQIAKTLAYDCDKKAVCDELITQGSGEALSCAAEIAITFKSWDRLERLEEIYAKILKQGSEGALISAAKISLTQVFTNFYHDQTNFKKTSVCKALIAKGSKRTLDWVVRLAATLNSADYKKEIYEKLFLKGSDEALDCVRQIIASAPSPNPTEAVDSFYANRLARRNLAQGPFQGSDRALAEDVEMARIMTSAEVENTNLFRIDGA
jgi:hypothetical protein